MSRNIHFDIILAMAGEGQNEADRSIEPSLNIASDAETEIARQLSNFANTPFELDGAKYASVESFWQGLYFPEGSSERKQIAQMTGKEAKKAAQQKPSSETVVYQGRQMTVGSPEHQDLMRQAIKAKLEQNPQVLAGLIETGDLKLTHFLYTKKGALEPDSLAIPRNLFSQILMELRDEFREKLSEHSDN